MGKLESTRAWKAKNREHIRAYNAAYKAANAEKVRAKMKLWRTQNKGNVKQYNKAYRAANKSAISIQNKEWRRKNHARFMESQRRRTARWEAKNPGARARRSELRRARIRQSTINPTSISEFFDLVKRKGSVRCYYCRRRTSTKKIHFDHIVSLAKGGRHEVQNLCASCPSCNLKKHTKPIQSLSIQGQQLFPI